MNRKYVKKQLVPKHIGKITQAQWEEFVKQKTEPEALATNDKFAEILKIISIPITWGQADMSVKLENGRKNRRNCHCRQT
jgi:hypothetical protein